MLASYLLFPGSVASFVVTAANFVEVVVSFAETADLVVVAESDAAVRYKQLVVSCFPVVVSESDAAVRHK